MAGGDLDPDALPPAVWTGQPVACTRGCGCHGLPVMGDDGWMLPVHSTLETTWPHRRVVCPGSMTPVTAPQAATSMEQRIEDHVVRAMPDRINDDWDTP